MTKQIGKNVMHQVNLPKCHKFKDLVFAHPTLGENLWEAMGEIAKFSIHI